MYQVERIYGCCINYFLSTYPTYFLYSSPETSIHRTCRCCHDAWSVTAPWHALQSHRPRPHHLLLMHLNPGKWWPCSRSQMKLGYKMSLLPFWQIARGRDSSTCLIEYLNTQGGERDWVDISSQQFDARECHATPSKPILDMIRLLIQVCWPTSFWV